MFLAALIDPARQILLFAPPILAAIVVVLGYGRIKILARSGTFTTRRTVCFLFAFVAGECYVILGQDQIGKLLHWESAWILLIVLLFRGVGISVLARPQGRVVQEASPRVGC